MGECYVSSNSTNANADNANANANVKDVLQQIFNDISEGKGVDIHRQISNDLSKRWSILRSISDSKKDNWVKRNTKEEKNFLRKKMILYTKNVLR